MANTQVVMAGIAQALVATAVGLLVALPAVAVYNARVRHVDARCPRPMRSRTRASRICAERQRRRRGNGGLAARRRGIIAEINVTPLVDIMLVLLIIFMLTANLLVRQVIEVALPPATKSVTMKPTTIAITLVRDGKLYLNDHPVAPDELRAAVAAAYAADDKLQVIISGDKDVAYGRVVWVLDLVKSLKVTSFAIRIDPTALVAPT